MCQEKTFCCIFSRNHSLKPIPFKQPYSEYDNCFSPYNFSTNQPTIWYQSWKFYLETKEKEAVGVVRYIFLLGQPYIINDIGTPIAKTQYKNYLWFFFKATFALTSTLPSLKCGEVWPFYRPNGLWDLLKLILLAEINLKGSWILLTNV